MDEIKRKEVGSSSKKNSVKTVRQTKVKSGAKENRAK